MILIHWFLTNILHPKYALEHRAPSIFFYFSLFYRAVICEVEIFGIEWVKMD